MKLRFVILTRDMDRSGVYVRLNLIDHSLCFTVIKTCVVRDRCRCKLRLNVIVCTLSDWSRRKLRGDSFSIAFFFHLFFFFFFINFSWGGGRKKRKRLWEMYNMTSDSLSLSLSFLCLFLLFFCFNCFFHHSRNASRRQSPLNDSFGLANVIYTGRDVVSADCFKAEALTQGKRGCVPIVWKTYSKIPLLVKKSPQREREREKKKRSRIARTQLVLCILFYYI